jgi:hypothetical protein
MSTVTDIGAAASPALEGAAVVAVVAPEWSVVPPMCVVVAGAVDGAAALDVSSSPPHAAAAVTTARRESPRSAVRARFTARRSAPPPTWIFRALADARPLVRRAGASDPQLVELQSVRNFAPNEFTTLDEKRKIHSLSIKSCGFG